MVKDIGSILLMPKVIHFLGWHTLTRSTKKKSSKLTNFPATTFIFWKNCSFHIRILSQKSDKLRSKMLKKSKKKDGLTVLDSLLMLSRPSSVKCKKKAKSKKQTKKLGPSNQHQIIWLKRNIILSTMNLTMKKRLKNISWISMLKLRCMPRRNYTIKKVKNALFSEQNIL